MTEREPESLSIVPPKPPTPSPAPPSDAEA
jgi:hypothetical protein